MIADNTKERRDMMWQDYSQNKSIANRNRLSLEYMDDVRQSAQRLHATLPKVVQLDDLISDGWLGLIGAIQRFDQTRGVQFTTFCNRPIRGAMLDGLRDMDWVPKQVRIACRGKKAGMTPVKLHSLSDLPERVSIADKKVRDPSYNVIRHDLMQFLTQGYNRTEALAVVLYYYQGLYMSTAGSVVGVCESSISKWLEAWRAETKSRITPELLL